MPEGVEIVPERLQGPQVEEDADADPREFLVAENRGDSRERLNLKIRYYVCAGTWRRPITQEYLITWTVDWDAKRVRSGRMDFNRVRGPGGRPGLGGASKEAVPSGRVAILAQRPSSSDFLREI